MTKAELVDKLSDKVKGLTQKQAAIVVNTIFDSIQDALASNDKLEISGFGSFKLRSRKQREGRNPKTGALVSVPAKLVPFFKAGKELKELVDGNK